jgi:hypothetical protein
MMDADGLISPVIIEDDLNVSDDDEGSLVERVVGWSLRK